MKKAGLPLGGPAFFSVVFSVLVHESPETLELPSALHQVRSRIRRRLRKDLVHEIPETLELSSALHQVRGRIRRRLQKDLVHESPETLDFSSALHQVRGPIRRRLQKDLVNESPETLELSLALHQVRGRIRLFRKSPEQNLQGLLQMFFRDGERREQAHLFPCRAGGDAQDAVFQAFINDVAGLFGSRCNGNHQAQTFYCRNPRSISESLEDHGGFSFYRIQKTLVQSFHDAQCAGAGHRVSAEGGAVSARDQSVPSLLAEHADADREAAAHAFCGGDDVRPEPQLFVRVQGAGAAVARLNLVANEEDVLLAAQLCQRIRELLSHHVDAAFSLNAFYDDGGGAVRIRQRFYAFRIVELRIFEARNQWLEAFVVVRIPGGGEGAVASAVKTVLHGDNFIAVRPFVQVLVTAGGLQRTLIGLAAGVGEEHVRHAGVPGQKLGEFGTRFRVVQVRSVLDFVELLLHRIDPVRIAEPEGVGSVPRLQIDVLLAVLVVGDVVAAPGDGHRETVVGSGDVLMV